MILFGAGASYGAGSVLPKPPPLGNNLYNELKHADFARFWYQPFLEEFGFTDPHLGFEASFEKVLQVKDDPYILIWLMREMAMYFAQFDCNVLQENNYYKLINSLQNKSLLKHVIISSLNYECIFEKVLDKMGLKYWYEFGNIETYDTSGIPIFKIHGSCNFIFNRSNIDIQHATGCGFLNIDAPLEALSISEAYNYYSYQSNGPIDSSPIMSFYAKGKAVPAASKAIYRMGDRWKNEVLEASDVYIIGVRYMPEDLHIWELIFASEANITFFGDMDNLDAIPMAIKNRSNFQFINEYFDQSCLSVPEMVFEKYSNI